MIKREVLMPEDLITRIAAIVDFENYEILKEAFSKRKAPPIFLDQEEAEALITLAVIEKKKARLKFPYHDDEHPQYNVSHEKEFDDVQMGLYEKIIYYVESAFKKGQFDCLL